MSFVAGQIIGDYELLGVIGAGGMGQVYRVKNVVTGRIEAMKILLPDLEDEAEAAQRFVLEIQVLAGLNHPNIAALHTAQRVENQLVMIMEFVEGITLAEKLQGGPLPLPEALSYICQTLSALGYAHERGVVHRDIKPANMMITPEGRLKLTDFGIAKAAGDSSLTKRGTTVGSPYYMSPEQVQNLGKEVDWRSDLYSLGLVLYEIATGRRPFEGDTDYAIMDAQVRTPPTPPIELKPGIPIALNDVILTALRKTPDQRFQTAEEFRRALEPLRPPADGIGTEEERAVYRSQPRLEPRDRNRRTAYLLLASLVLLVALIIAAVLVSKHPKPRATSPCSGLVRALSPSLAMPSGKMVLVPEGEARLGEKLHPVAVGAFYIDSTEVTNKAYLEFCDQTGHAIPSKAEKDPQDYPVVDVTFDDAQAFCQWASKWLPTAQEWEKGARGTDGRIYPWGDALDYGRANIPRDEIAARRATLRGAMSYEAGASPYGALNMLGNAWEWVSSPAPGLDDGEFDKLKAKLRSLTPPLSREDPLYQVRGGSYRYFVPADQAPALIWDDTPMPTRARENDIGFRCAKDASPR